MGQSGRGGDAGNSDGKIHTSTILQGIPTEDRGQEIAKRDWRQEVGLRCVNFQGKRNKAEERREGFMLEKVKRDLQPK